jgi:two-component system CheB/CheR fusion protein
MPLRGRFSVATDVSRLPEKLVRDLLDFAPDASIIVDSDGNIVFANVLMERLFGYSPEALHGRSVESLLPERFRTRHPLHRAKFAEQPVRRPMGTGLDLYGLHRDGHEFSVEISLSPVQADDDLLIACAIRDVTARKQFEDSLTGIMENSLNEIYIFGAEDLRFIQVNRGAVVNIGYTMEELSQLTPLDLKPIFTRASFMQRLDPLLQGEQDKVVFETVHRRKDGSLYPVEVHLQYTKFESAAVFVAIILDTTERQDAQKALRDSEKRFRDLAHGLPLIVWTHNPDGKYEFVNRTFCNFFGVTEAVVLEGNWRMPIHQEDEDYRTEFNRCMHARSDFHRVARVRNANGEWRWIESFAQPRISVPGTLKEYIGTSLDITERKQVAENRRIADKRKDEFLATLAHELRNPLAPIVSSLEIMGMMTDPIQIEAARSVAERQVRHLTRLVDDLIDIARIDSGKLEIRTGNTTLQEIVTHAIETCRPLIASRGHTLEVKVPEETVSLEGDLTRLSQVLSNLLTNSAKYTPDGGHIWLSAGLDGQAACMLVRDSGYGIAPDKISHIFEMFGQLEHPSPDVNKGLGIGLTLAHRLVALHGGELKAMSDGEGKGSTFTIRLPLKQARAPGNSGASVREDEMADKRSDVMRRVLIVDDNVDAAAALQQLIRAVGYQTETVHTGKAALAAAESFQPQVVLIDIGLPDISGHDVARSLRQTPHGSNALLIAVTGFGSDRDKAISRDAGFDFHEVKPVNIATLRELMTKSRATS